MRFPRTTLVSTVLLPLGLLSLHCSSGNDTTGTGGGTGGTASSSTTSTTTTSSSTSSTGGGGAGGGFACAGGHLDPALAWYGTNRDQLDALLDTKGCKSPGFDPKKRPLATFDWDNTVIKNDVGDATMYWMIAHDLVKQPKGKDWGTTSVLMTAEAKADLNAACDALAAADQPLPTSKTDAASVACANVIFTIYNTGATVTSDPSTTKPFPAFAGYKYRRMEPAYAWAAQLQAPYSLAEIKAFATMAIDANLANPVDTTQVVGGNTAAFWIRVYDQQKDLIAKLSANGFDVWIVSASPEPVVQAFAGHVGVAQDHVLGIRLDPGTSNIAQCGGEPVITYMDGKRCWINKVILNVAGDPFAKAPDADRQVFAAGDSNTDIAFVRDATTTALVLNRNKKELMCHAYWDYNVKKTGKWLINPMFIEPKAQLASMYPCSTTACIDDAGKGVPCVDDQANVIQDQADTVF